MLSPKKFSQITGLSYEQTLSMCKAGEINAIKTAGGQFKIPEKETDKYFKNDDFVSKEEYLKIARENERLKTLLYQAKSFIESLNI